MTIEDKQRLLDRIEQLETLLGADRSTAGRLREILGLEPMHAQILGMFLKREFVTRDGLYTVLYEGRPECEWPEEKILDVQICKLRRYLKRRGIDITIKTKHGEGWSMAQVDKMKLRAVIAPKPDVPPTRRAGAVSDFPTISIRSRERA